MNLPRTAHVIWAALLASVFVYIAVAYAVPVKPSIVPVAVLSTALWVVAAVLLVSALLIHRKLLNPEMVRKYAGEPLARRGISIESAEAREFLRSCVGQWVLKVHLISWAMGESISLLGLVAALVTGRPSAVLPLSIASLLLILGLRPNFSVVDAIAPRNDPRS
jgi:hypothetical protein